ncbi:MAG: cellulase family glycosylhydrolase [Chloroflexi bacterium]|nr:cellulase family glycosylhydrolase [Chloroflexota bacterium]
MKRWLARFVGQGAGTTSILLFVVISSLNLALAAVASDTAPGLRVFLPTVRTATCAPQAATQDPTPDGVRAMLADLRLMNYYPSTIAWTNMWTRWNPSLVDADFARIAAMRGNTVRIIISPSAVGYPVPSPAGLDKLSQIVALASKHGLRVQLTLFDWWKSYGDVNGSKRWASGILSAYTSDPRIAFIELQNEIDPSDTRVMGWVHAILPCVRSLAGTVPVTVSVSGDPGGNQLRKLIASGESLSFYNVHYFLDSVFAYQQLRQARQIAGPTPLFIGETGRSTYPTDETIALGRDQAWREAYQDRYHRTLQYAARAAGLPIPAPWVLSDFIQGAIPPGETASDASQYHYGLYRADGTAKPAAATISNAFAGRVIDTSFNNGFESADDHGMPTNWGLWLPSSATFSRDATVARTGAASARISSSTANAVGVPAFFVTPVKHILPGQSYTSSVWAKGSAATGTTSITLAWFDASRKWITNNGSATLPVGTTSWTQLTARSQAPANAAFVEIHLASANNSGTVWFDDVTFE